MVEHPIGVVTAVLNEVKVVKQLAQILFCELCPRLIKMGNIPKKCV